MVKTGRKNQDLSPCCLETSPKRHQPAMPLIKTSQCLVSLRSQSAVGCFSAYNLEMLMAIIAGAEKAGRSATVSLDPNSGHVDFEKMADYALLTAKKASVPISVHLNHGRTLEIIQQALHAGILSVMFDGSNLSYEENINLTSQARIMAHQAGAEIEGEFGPLCTRQEDLSSVLDFLSRTEIDTLAFSISKDLSISDQIKGIDLLAVISEKTGVPLVLHGASRLPVWLLKQAIRSGVRKINVHSELLHVLKKSLHQEGNLDATKNPLASMARVSREVQMLVVKNINLFAATN
jgi:fructose/tagatose bisphosphate aldolase